MSVRGPYVVGLTGGIASGKSAVAAEFAARGVSVIDADQ
ncbi:MAG: dephospho-CoA kinase, partial [Pseudomonadales bacterium]|nr:dephospho-CoA kinase [Pseudomonadales bacterium]